MSDTAAPSLPAVLDDSALCDLLLRARTIAVIGWSDKEDRSSHGIADYLHAQGYDAVSYTHLTLPTIYSV